MIDSVVKFIESLFPSIKESVESSYNDIQHVTIVGVADTIDEAERYCIFGILNYISKDKDFIKPKGEEPKNRKLDNYLCWRTRPHTEFNEEIQKYRCKTRLSTGGGNE